MSSRLPPIFPVCLFCQLPKTTEELTKEKNKHKQASNQAGLLFVSQPTFPSIKITIISFDFVFMRRTSVKGAAAEEQGATSAQLPLGNSRFYIPPLISIKITVIRQHARHEVDEAVE